MKILMNGNWMEFPSFRKDTTEEKGKENENERREAERPLYPAGGADR